MRATTSTSSRAPNPDRSRSTVSLVSLAAMSRLTLANIAPASRRGVTRMMVTPVTVSPFITARCTGAAPR
jgi:hypothetical protein